jgi:hypothetical protein
MLPVPGSRVRPVKKAAVMLAGAALLLFSGTALATHPHPQGASPTYISLVPAYKQCGTPNTTHGPPLAFASCRPPVRSSASITVGTADSNGAAAHSIGHIDFKVLAVPPEDVHTTLSFSDVRCTPSVSPSVCTLSNAQDGPDYSGDIQALFVSRITDHFNGPNLTDAATVVDIPFPVNTTCQNTSSTAVGGLCSVSTSFNTILPGVIKDDQRQNWEIGQVQIQDGGNDGATQTSGDNNLFAVEGTFVP